MIRFALGDKPAARASELNERTRSVWCCYHHQHNTTRRRRRRRHQWEGESKQVKFVISVRAMTAFYVRARVRPTNKGRDLCVCMCGWEILIRLHDANPTKHTRLYDPPSCLITRNVFRVTAVCRYVYYYTSMLVNGAHGPDGGGLAKQQCGQINESII